MGAMQRTLDRIGLSGLFRSSVDRIDDSIEPESLQPQPQIQVSEPSGVVSPDGRTSGRRLFDWLTEYANRSYTDEELYQASTLPMVEMIIEAISRDVSVHTLNAIPVPSLVGDKWALDMAREFEQIFAFPYKGYTYRELVSDIVRDMLIIGKCPIEMLRDVAGQSSRYATVGLLGMFQDGTLDPQGFLDAVEVGLKYPGPIVGLMRYAPECIKERRMPNGAYYSKAFMDLSSFLTPGNPASAQDMHDVDTAPSWNENDFTMIRYSSGKKFTFSSPKSPTSRMYPLIDVLYTVLYRVKDQLDGRMRDKLVSFEQTKVGAGTTFISPEQIGTIVETVKRDIASGEVPVLGGVTARVSDLGQAQVMSENMSLLDQMVAVLNIGYGAGALEMGQVIETATGMQEAQRVARKQQVGNMLRVIKNELFGFVMKDPYSIWGSVLTLRYVTDLYALDFQDRMRILLDTVKHGMPMGLLLEMEMPEWAEALRARGIDPYEIIDPAVLSAMVASGMPVKVPSSAEGDMDGGKSA